MDITSQTGASRHPTHGLAGSSESDIKNQADTATADAQGPKTIELPDIPSGSSSLTNSIGDIDHPSLPAPVKEALAEIQSTASKLSSTDLKTVLMDMSAILGMMFLFAKELQATGRMARKEAALDKMNHSLNAADKIKTAGEARHESARLSAALKIAGGAIQIAASSISMYCSWKGASALGLGDEAGAKAWGGGADFFNGLSKGMDSIIQGVGALYTADLDFDAVKADSQKAIYDALAAADESKGNEANEVLSMAAELMKKIMDVLETLMDGSHNLNSRITGYMV